MKIFLTGAAGFIGSYVAKLLCKKGHDVAAVDNLNDYYDVRLKEWRLDNLKKNNNFNFIKADIEDAEGLDKIFSGHKFDAVINLAARAGVRYSIVHPHVYVATNITGTLNLLECCRKNEIKKFVLASTSSLYAGKELPFREDVPTTTPISPYAATKGGAEEMVYSYHYLYDIDVSVLRYFTVYGPAGRPDMSVFRFIKGALADEPIIMNGDGSQRRDFTYVEDIAEGTVKALKNVGYEIINLGGNHPYSMNEVVSVIESLAGRKLKIKNMPFPKEDMKAIYADINKANKLLDWNPQTNLHQGLQKTYNWSVDNLELVKSIKV